MSLDFANFAYDDRQGMISDRPIIMSLSRPNFGHKIYVLGHFLEIARLVFALHMIDRHDV